MKKIISFIQVFAIVINMHAQLPESVDNSTKIFFYEIFDQKPLSGENYQSCAQAAGVAYTFCYEINRHRNLNADSPENQYPQTYTWNYMNCADYNTLSYVHDGWDIIKNNGCPNMVKWGTGNFWDYLIWMDGYEKYLDGIKNRISSYSYMDIDQQSGLASLKQWLFNHNQSDFILRKLLSIKD